MNTETEGPVRRMGKLFEEIEKVLTENKITKVEFEHITKVLSEKYDEIPFVKQKERLKPLL